MNKSLYIFFLLIAFALGVMAQTPDNMPEIFKQEFDDQAEIITISEAIELAKINSIDALVVYNTFKINYWRYRDYQANLLPNVTLTGNLPTFNRSLSTYQKEDGSYTFLSSRYISLDGTLSLEQNIPFTGGSLSIQSRLERLDHLSSDQPRKYLAVPLTFTLSQPLFTSRPLFWAGKIEPERYLEATKDFNIDMERISLKTIGIYFDLLISKLNMEIANQNYKNATQLYEIALEKSKIGLISDNDIKQLHLGQLNASAQIILSQQEYEEKMHTFKNYLRMDKRTNFHVTIPSEPPHININENIIMRKVYENHSFRHSIKRRLYEAEQLISVAKAERGFQANLYVSVGFADTDNLFKDLYRNLQNQQLVSFGVRIPILDWGKGKGKVQLARLESERLKASIEQESDDFEQNILLAIKQFQAQASLISIYYTAIEVAKQRYNTAFETFKIGNISVLDINNAINEENTAQRNYINQLYVYWLYYYNLRQLTLFDFASGTEIRYNHN